MSTSDKTREGWTGILGELERRQGEARAMGGPDKLAKQRRDGRLDARQRIEALCDPGSFRELGTLVSGLAREGSAPTPADALVAGTASIDGRPVVVGSEDFTVRGGSIGIGTHAKRVRLAQLAAQERMPLVMMLEGAGERATNALQRYPYAPNDLQLLAGLSGKVPTVAVVAGASAGHGALTALLADFVVMVEGSALFSAGPPLVAIALGEQVSKEELGGAALHVGASGVAHNLAATEEAAFALVRDYLGFFPQNAWQRPPLSEAAADRGRRRLDDILDLVPPDANKAYDMRRVLRSVFDEGRFLEIQPLYGRSIITALARLGGRPLCVVANQPSVMAGAITKEAAEKAARFLELAEAFHFPVLFIADNPGVMAGSQAERAGTLRAAARMYMAQSHLSGAKLHVTMRKAFGFGSSLMAMNPFDRQTVSLALPAISLGGIPAAGGGVAAKLSQTAGAELEAIESEGAWRAADNLAYDEVIDPRELRNALLDALARSAGRDSEAPAPVAHTGVRP